MTVKCSCNGGNPSCYKCDGWGYIEEGVREKPIDSGVKPPVRKFTEKGQLVKCGGCKKRFPSKSAHFRQYQKASMQKKIKTEDIAKCPNCGSLFVKCPNCGCSIKPRNLEEHRKKRCPKR